MNFAIVKSSRIPTGKLPLHRKQISTLIEMTGCPKRVESATGYSKSRPIRKKTGYFSPAKITPLSELYRIYEWCMKFCREGIIKHHPDRRGDETVCANFTSLRRELQKRFDAIGLKYGVGKFSEGA